MERLSVFVDSRVFSPCSPLRNRPETACRYVRRHVNTRSDAHIFQ